MASSNASNVVKRDSGTISIIEIFGTAAAKTKNAVAATALHLPEAARENPNSGQ
ncbi:MAG: hypothetical protein R3E31_14325 [Chloroflexota bacterium]